MKKIFEKYNYELPKPVSESNFNLYLKENLIEKLGMKVEEKDQTDPVRIQRRQNI